MALYKKMYHQVDNNGRIVIPYRIRAKLGIYKNESALETFVDGDIIIVRKYDPSLPALFHNSNGGYTKMGSLTTGENLQGE